MDDRRQRRPAAKVILVDPSGRVLLFRGADHARPGRSCWFAPGGGIERGESSAVAARREVLEETGLVLGDLGPVVYRRTAEFEIDGNAVVGQEVYFVVPVDHFEPSSAGWTDHERRFIEGHHWWTTDELDQTPEVVYPERLSELVHRHAVRRPPSGR